MFGRELLKEILIKNCSIVSDQEMFQKSMIRSCFEMPDQNVLSSIQFETDRSQDPIEPNLYSSTVQRGEFI